jgi:hypothetical protein
MTTAGPYAMALLPELEIMFSVTSARAHEELFERWEFNCSVDVEEVRDPVPLLCPLFSPELPPGRDSDEGRIRKLFDESKDFCIQFKTTHINRNS